jgi:hypothetical protein
MRALLFYAVRLRALPTKNKAGIKAGMALSDPLKKAGTAQT